MNISLKKLKLQNKKILQYIVGFAISTPLVILFMNLFDGAEDNTLDNVLITIAFSIVLWAILFFYTELLSMKIISVAPIVIMVIYPLLLIYFNYFNNTKTNLKIHFVAYFLLLFYSAICLIKYYTLREDVYFANIFYVLLFPTLVLFMHSLRGIYHVYIFSNAFSIARWIFSILVTIIAVVVFFINHNRRKKE